MPNMICVTFQKHFISFLWLCMVLFTVTMNPSLCLECIYFTLAVTESLQVSRLMQESGLDMTQAQVTQRNPSLCELKHSDTLYTFSAFFSFKSLNIISYMSLDICWWNSNLILTPLPIPDPGATSPFGSA